jgi:hypothetical protein
MELYKAKFKELYEKGSPCEITAQQLLTDPFLSCCRNFLAHPEVVVEIEAVEQLARSLPDDHRVITYRDSNKCTFVDSKMSPILEGQIFRVGTYKELDDRNASWTWEMKFREPFELIGGTKDFIKFCKNTTTIEDCAKLMDWLRICAIIIDCNYVDLRDDVGYFIRGLRLCTGLCPCGKNGNFRCRKCKKNYCSKECQVADWPTHKHVCRKL